MLHVQVVKLFELFSRSIYDIVFWLGIFYIVSIIGG